MYKIILLIISIFLTSCSNSNNLQLIRNNKQSFIITHDIISNKIAGFPRSTITTVFKKGKYTSYAKDSQGTYFNGPKYCYTWSSSNKNLHSITANCGIYIFDDKSRPHRAYSYTNSIKRISDNKKASDILQSTYGVGSAVIINIIDPEIVFEKDFNVIISNKIHWVKQ